MIKVNIYNVYRELLRMDTVIGYNKPTSFKLYIPLIYLSWQGHKVLVNVLNKPYQELNGRGVNGEELTLFVLLLQLQ